MKPLIGISCCALSVGAFGMAKHAASDTYVRAVDEIVGGVPVLVPANGDRCDADTLVARLDGIILTGSRSNVEPARYGGPVHAEGTPEDHARDAMVFALVRRAIAVGLPVLAICRGMQELNVALGGSLHQRLQDLPDRLDHSTPMQPDPRIRQGKAHEIRITPGTWLHRIARSSTIAVNSLHNQGMDRLGAGLVAEAIAPDGTVEAVRLAGAPFVVGLQWHPEYDCGTDHVSRGIFEAFANAVEERATGARNHSLIAAG